MNFDNVLISVTFITRDSLRTLHAPASDPIMSVRDPTTPAEDEAVFLPY
jgi:hypothetical protein